MNFTKRCVQSSGAPTDLSQSGCCLRSPSCDSVSGRFVCRARLCGESSVTPVRTLLCGALWLVVFLSWFLLATGPTPPVVSGLPVHFMGLGRAPADGVRAPLHHAADRTFVWPVLVLRA